MIGKVLASLRLDRARYTRLKILAARRSRTGQAVLITTLEAYLEECAAASGTTRPADAARLAGPGHARPRRRGALQQSGARQAIDEPARLDTLPLSAIRHSQSMCPTARPVLRRAVSIRRRPVDGWK
jgi:hypothetical protein